MFDACLHGEKERVAADRSYDYPKLRETSAEHGVAEYIGIKTKPGHPLSAWAEHMNRVIASIRAKCEHPCRVIERQFGYVKVRYRGPDKNTAQFNTLFALSNLWMARRLSLAAGEVLPLDIENEGTSLDELAKFRVEVRAWLEANCPPSMRTPPTENDIIMSGSKHEFKNEDQRLWFERMRDKGWFAPNWPVALGGGGLDATHHSILEVELSRMRCRPPQINLGIWMIGPVLLEFGTDEQKQRFLPSTARGEIGWCQGFSEPNAGSDLAALKTSGKLEGDHFVVNGSKIWTSYAAIGDYMYALVRTNAAVPKQQGISLLLIDMKSPGITVRPIDLISGKSHFCQVFFDEVEVPANNLVGTLDGGWTVAKRLLQHERNAMSKFTELNIPGPNLLSVAKKALGDATGRIASPVLRDKVAAIEIDAQAQLLTQQRIVEMMKAKKDIFNVTSIMKYQSAETAKRSTETMIAALGWRGLGWEDPDVFTSEELEATKHWLNAKALSIAGGTSEVQLNIIAKRVLGLPE